MIEYTKGNLLEADVDALVNTVNTVGVMGKGIALMFKEAFPENFRAYADACRSKDVQTGKMFITERSALVGPNWIINFPTKQHWRAKSNPQWIDEGLLDLRKVIANNNIKSIAIPPLGSGNGGLDWLTVKPKIEKILGDLSDVRIVIFEPTAEYQNVERRVGVEKLTPARALIAELVRRYWMLGIDCSLLEIQKLAWFMERAILKSGQKDPMDLRFEANRYGPYADRLRHLLDSLDGSYLRCDKRLADARPEDVIWFEQSRKDKVHAYLKSSEALPYQAALEQVSDLIDGFQSPLGMELLATVDWLIEREECKPDVESIKQGLQNWPAGSAAAERKVKLFDDNMLGLAIERLESF
ncbi:macro domain-containing protein [Allohahella sp. A8]|uniref:type II toxin-antitoxin system antitoxin DNA ADP-ribosyl glycohydrolase DarG n=1 Tax=Allohahella sp. A8 TaxID=3141461 RepID=UPI003A7F7C24